MKKKSRLQSYGRWMIDRLLLSFVLSVITTCLPFVDAEKAGLVFGGFAALSVAIGTVTGLTIARYGARETALSARGNYIQAVDDE